MMCTLSVHIQYPSHIISYSHFFKQIQSIRGIATSDSESTHPVLAKVELDESDLRKVERAEGDEDEDILSARVKRRRMVLFGGGMGGIICLIVCL